MTTTSNLTSTSETTSVVPTFILPFKGIYGWNTIEPHIFTCLFTADNLILIGDRGANKTTAITKIFHLWNKDNSLTRTYSVPNLNFEDLLGMINPASLMDGECTFIKGKHTIWEAQQALFGELNRSNPETQGKVLQILQEKTCMGIVTDLVHAWADMNPLSYLGTQPLDPAVSDRFCMALQTPAFHELSIIDKNKISSSAHGVSFLSLDKDTKSKLVQQKTLTSEDIQGELLFEDLRDYVAGPNGCLVDVFDEYREPVGKYLAQVVEAMKNQYTNKNVKAEKNKTGESMENNLHALWSGRKVQMLSRAILTGIAIKQWYYGKRRLSKEELIKHVLDVISVSDVSGKTSEQDPFDKVAFQSAHLLSVKFLENIQENSWGYMFNFLSMPEQKLYAMLRGNKLNSIVPGSISFLADVITIDCPYTEKAVLKGKHKFFEDAFPTNPIETDYTETMIRPMANLLAIAPLITCNDVNTAFKDTLTNNYSKLIEFISSLKNTSEYTVLDPESLEWLTMEQERLVEASRASTSLVDQVPLLTFLTFARAYFFCIRFIEVKDSNGNPDKINYSLLRSYVKKHVEYAEKCVIDVKKYVEPGMRHFLNNQFEGIVVPDTSAIDNELTLLCNIN